MTTDRDEPADSSHSRDLPKLTVVIAVRNGENFLRETLESVFAQGYPAVEVIVVNDGSTDSTAAIAGGFGDKVHLINRSHAGVSSSRNHGLSIAETEWVALMDHDDLWEKNHLGNLAKAIARQPDADICYTGRRNLFRDPVTGNFRAGEPVEVPAAEDVSRVLLERCAFMPSCVALRRSKVMEIGGFDKRHVNAQDWDLWLRLRSDGARFIHSPEPTLLYRVHPAAATNKPLIALTYYRRVVEEDVLPELSFFARHTRGRRLVSRLEGEAAILMRQNGLPGALGMMARSIMRHPFHNRRRYQVAAHMMIHSYEKTAPVVEVLSGVRRKLPPLKSELRETR